MHISTLKVTDPTVYLKVVLVSDRVHDPAYVNQSGGNPRRRTGTSDGLTVVTHERILVW